MTEKFKGKYRITSTRLQNWNYGWNASYFVTICTGDRECYFGDIANGKLKLSEIGMIADKIWSEIPKQFPFINLDTYVIMPDHVHGILIIDNNQNRDAINRVSTGGKTGIKNPMLHDNLSRVIRWYKGRVTFEIRKINKDFHWQSRFHDHVIRDDRSLNNIRRYITENPDKWVEDKLNSSV